MSPGPGGGGSGVPSPPSANLLSPSGGGSGGGSGVPSPPNARCFRFGEFPRFFELFELPGFFPPDFFPLLLRFAAVFFRAELARRGDFLAADFLRVVRFAAVFLRLGFLAADFRRADFFAAPRLATPLRAVFLRPPFRAAIGVSPRLKIYFPATAFSPRIAASRSL